MIEREWFLPAVALFSFGLCYISVPVCRWVARRSGFMDRPGDGHKSHGEPVPLLGGLAVYISVWGSLLGLTMLGVFTWGVQLWGIFLGSTVVLIMGTVDDAVGLTPIVKFFLQVGAALLVVLYGVVLSLFIGTGPVTVLLTLIWIVGITNSFNLLDNMDGLTGGVAAICAFLFSVNAYRQQDVETLVLSLVLLGCLVAFLRFNFEPAEIFLGDAGSGFLGFFLGCLSVSANYLEHSQLQQLPIISPLLIFSVPLFDTFSVMAIRVLEGRSIWQADNQHFSHRLVALGLTRRSAVLVIYLVTFTVGMLAVLLPRVDLMDAILLLVHAVAIFGIIVLLEYAGAAQEQNPPDS